LVKPKNYLGSLLVMKIVVLSEILKIWNADRKFLIQILVLLRLLQE